MAKMIREDEDLAEHQNTTKISTEGFVIPPLADDGDQENRTQDEKDENREIMKNYGCPLPKEYDNLFHLFVNMEKVVAVVYNRGSRITFESVIRNVVKNTKRTFSETQLEQILYVYPQSYKIRWEKKKQTAGRPAMAGNYDLVMTPNLYDDLPHIKSSIALKIEDVKERRANFVSPVKLISPVKKRTERDFHRKSPMKAMTVPLPRPAKVDPGPKMDGRRRTDRKLFFRHLLVGIVRKAHDQFLALKKLSIPNDVFPHTDFELESCPPLERRALPSLPTSMTPLRSARDYFKVIPQNKTPEKQELPPLDENLLKSPPKGAVQSMKSIITPKLSLLERIRARDTAKKSVDKTKVNELTRRCEMLELLQTTMVDVICSHFTLEKVRSMSICKLMSLVGSKLNRDAFVEHIDILCEASGGLCVKQTHRAESYLKISNSSSDKIRERVTNVLELTRRELQAIKLM